MDLNKRPCKYPIPTVQFTEQKMHVFLLRARLCCCSLSRTNGIAISVLGTSAAATKIVLFRRRGWIKAGLGIRSLPISLKSNERLWGIRSDRSRQMNDRERIAQAAQRKWATVSKSLSSLTQDKWAAMSDSLRLLRGNERMCDSLKKIWLNNLKSCLLVCFMYGFFI